MSFSPISRHPDHCRNSTLFTTHVSTVLLALFLPRRHIACSSRKKKVRHSVGFKVFLLKSAARRSVQQNIQQDKREMLAVTLLRVSNVLQTAEQRFLLDLTLHTSKQVGGQLGWELIQVFIEQSPEQQQLNMPIMLLSQESSFCPCFVCRPTKKIWSPESCQAQKGIILSIN